MDTELTLVTGMSEAEEYLAKHAVDIVLLDLGLTEGASDVQTSVLSSDGISARRLRAPQHPPAAQQPYATPVVRAVNVSY